MRCPPPIEDAIAPDAAGLVVDGALAVEPLPGEPPEVLPVVLEPAVLPVDPAVLGALLPAPDIEFDGARVPVTSILCPACAVRSWVPGSRM
jgi:hypothetical protein